MPPSVWKSILELYNIISVTYFTVDPFGTVSVVVGIHVCTSCPGFGFPFPSSPCTLSPVHVKDTFIESVLVFSCFRLIVITYCCVFVLSAEVTLKVKELSPTFKFFVLLWLSSDSSSPIASSSEIKSTVAFGFSASALNATFSTLFSTSYTKLLFAISLPSTTRSPGVITILLISTLSAGFPPPVTENTYMIGSFSPFWTIIRRVLAPFLSSNTFLVAVPVNFVLFIQILSDLFLPATLTFKLLIESSFNAIS